MIMKGQNTCLKLTDHHKLKKKKENFIVLVLYKIRAILLFVQRLWMRRTKLEKLLILIIYSFLIAKWTQTKFRR